MTRLRTSVGIALALLAAALLVVGVAGVVRATATQSWPCPASWFPLSAQPASVQQQCSQLKEQAQQSVIATAQARPYATTAPRPIGTYEALARENPAVTPVPPGQLPPEVQSIKQIDASVFAGRAGHPKPITSVWQLGGIPSPSQPGYGVLLLYAWGPNPEASTATIARDLWAVDGMPNIASQTNPAWGAPYYQVWGCPRAIGEITITGVTGPNGVVSFTSSSGVSGTLDMATGAWTFSS